MMSNGVKVCANCGAVLFGQWFDWDRQAYECRRCHALTGPEGELLGNVPSRVRSFDPRGFVLIGLIILAVVAIYIAQQLQ